MADQARTHPPYDAILEGVRAWTLSYATLLEIRLDRSTGLFGLVYTLPGDDRRLGYQCNIAELTDYTETLIGWTDPDDVRYAVDVLTEAIDEPLGWGLPDLLTEEDGVWWWGDGYKYMQDHPDYPEHHAYTEAIMAFHLHGAPHPGPRPGSDPLPPGATVRPLRPGEAAPRTRRRTD